MRRIYLDYNATTPIHPDAAAAIRPFLSDYFGNPSSAHWAGRDARVRYEEARASLARFVNADPAEIIFESCGSESDNHALKGVAFSRRDRGNHIISTTVEHPAVLSTLKYLEGFGFDVTLLPVSSEGIVEPEDVEKALREGTILVSVMYANNETGTLMPVKEIGRIAASRGVLFHSDMVQALGKVDIDLKSIGVDLASFSGHKLYAPKGVGALFMRAGLDIDLLIHGGHQEAGRRAGTENVMGACAFGAACGVLQKEMAAKAGEIDALRGKLLSGIREQVDEGIRLNGHKVQRLPNTLSLTIPGVEAESLVIALDLAGIAVSAGAACSAGATIPSHVLTAMGMSPTECRSTVRFSLGYWTTEEEIDYVLTVLPGIVRRLKGQG